MRKVWVSSDPGLNGALNVLFEKVLNAMYACCYLAGLFQCTSIANITNASFYVQRKRL